MPRPTKGPRLGGGPAHERLLLAGLAAQLFTPISTLRAAVEGDHTITVRVTPENLGPVTVHAHVAHGELDVQLFAPTTHAREALAAMLPDLRRDLASAGSPGTSTSVALGTGDGAQRGSANPFSSGAGQQGGGPRSDRWGDTRLRADPATAARPSASATPTSPNRAANALLDVLA